MKIIIKKGNLIKLNLAKITIRSCHFFLQLTHYIQQSIGTIPVIDLDAYSRAIGFKVDGKI